MVGMTGGARLDRRLAGIGAKLKGGGKLKVGFLSGATYDNGMTVAEVALINNFGAPAAGVPARPFFSNMVAERKGGWPERLRRLLRLCNYDVNRALDMMGAGIAGQLRQSIVDTNAPPNSPATNLLKQRFPTGGYDFNDVLAAWDDAAAGMNAAPGKPLVWTGQMLNSVDHVVEGGDDG